MSLWRPRQNDLPALLGIAIIPLVVALPELAGLLHDNPLIYLSDAARNVRGGWLPGYPYIDPNDAYTTQALGRLVATDWWHGLIPWWNPYSGVGLPLAAEYQPAAFFPLTLLLRFPGGMIWVHLLLQILAGWGAYALLRQLGVRRLAALTGGILFAQNGTLAWFAHASAGPVPFLPWVLLGIERAVAKASLRDPFGWRMLAVAIAMMLLAGFPETAYICGLFALAWSVLRLAQYKSGCRLSVMWRILLGGGNGVALAAPQISGVWAVLATRFYWRTRWSLCPDCTSAGGDRAQFACALCLWPDLCLWRPLGSLERRLGQHRRI